MFVEIFFLFETNRRFAFPERRTRSNGSAISNQRQCRSADHHQTFSEGNANVRRTKRHFAMFVSRSCGKEKNLRRTFSFSPSPRNGVTSSGQFAALCNAIDKMQTEQIVDPFKIVRLLRSVRPQFVDQVRRRCLSLFREHSSFRINTKLCSN